MEFSVEFYESETGRCPVREFLDELEATDPGDSAAVVAGIAKLRDRQYHRAPLSNVNKKTNFDRYLEEHLRDPGFAARFGRADEAWDVALQLAALREECGLSQKELAKLVGTSQQQISRLESPSYEGHTLSMLRRVAEALGANVRVSLDADAGSRHSVAEGKARYGKKR